MMYQSQTSDKLDLWFILFHLILNKDFDLEVQHKIRITVGIYHRIYDGFCFWKNCIYK